MISYPDRPNLSMYRSGSRSSRAAWMSFLLAFPDSSSIHSPHSVPMTMRWSTSSPPASKPCSTRLGSALVGTRSSDLLRRPNKYRRTLVACVIVGFYLWLNDEAWKYVVQHVLLR